MMLLDSCRSYNFNVDDKRRRSEQYSHAAIDLAGLMVALLVVALTTPQGRSFRAIVIAGSFVGAVTVFVAFAFIVRWFRDRRTGVRETRESLVLSYLAALDRSSLNPAAPLPLASDRHLATLRRE